MNEQVEKLVRAGIDAGAMVDVTFEAGGDVRLNIYPREPEEVEPEPLVVTLDCNTAGVREAIEQMHADVNARLEAGARTSKRRFRL